MHARACTASFCYATDANYNYIYNYNNIYNYSYIYNYININKKHIQNTYTKKSGTGVCRPRAWE